MSEAREEILARIRAALSDVPSDEPRQWEGPGPVGAADAYRRGPAPNGPGILDLFAERVADYRAEVVRCAGDAAVAREIAAACRRHTAHRMLVAPGLPGSWLDADVAWIEEGGGDPLDVSMLDSADGVLSAARVAIAETGTIALDHGPGQGRRALTLVPDLHLCVVRADQVVATVPEGLQRLQTAAQDGRPITLVSGPSATSDIELERVEGVHGPRRLVVLVVE